MRIFHISWEYPPVIYGGLGRHVLALTRAQAAAGHDVTVITQRPVGSPAREQMDGVTLIRTRAATPPVRRDVVGLMRWTAELDEQLAATVAALNCETPDVVHVHDWVVERAAREAGQRWPVPVVATVHATEAGRHAGWIVGEISESVYAAEWRLARRATAVIACSQAMATEATTLYGLPPERVFTIPNGIDLARWSVERPAAVCQHPDNAQISADAAGDVGALRTEDDPAHDAPDLPTANPNANPASPAFPASNPASPASPACGCRLGPTTLVHDGPASPAADQWASTQPVSTRSPKSAAHPLILFVGRLEWEKGIQVLIAAAKLLATTPQVDVVIAGVGTQSDHLRELAATDDRVSFIGQVPDGELLPLLSRAAVVVVPSLYEPFGIVALEAAAVGTALIVSDVGGLAEIVTDGATGLTVPVNKPGALAAAITAVLADPAAAQTRAAALRARLPEIYSWGRIAQRTIEVYRAARTMRAPTPVALTATPPQPAGQLLDCDW